MKLLIRNGRVIDPVNRLNNIQDVLIEDQVIACIGKNLECSDCQVIDASGKIVCPGFIDIHVHLREPGFEYKEDIVSGTRAAAAGGFTTVCCMPNTEPVIDSAAVASFVRERARKSGVVNVYPVGAITKGSAGEELTEIAQLVSAGCVAISDDGRPVTKSNIMRNALEYAKMFDLTVMSHCEELSLSKNGQMHEGFYSTIYGLRGIPAAAEEIMVARDIILSRETGGHVHICHISTKGSADMIRKAKAEGINVTCEVTPHHLTLTDEIVGNYDGDTKVNPPLRSKDHVAALREALMDGTIDCIATDHAPHHAESKDCEYNLASFGISGLETAVSVLMNSMVKPGIMSLEMMVQLFSAGPADVLGLDKGTLDIGKPADITIIDPEKIRQVDTNRFYSKGKNNPYKGQKLKGWVWATIVSGKVVYQE